METWAHGLDVRAALGVTPSTPTACALRAGLATGPYSFSWGRAARMPLRMRSRSLQGDVGARKPASPILGPGRDCRCLRRTQMPLAETSRPAGDGCAAPRGAAPCVLSPSRASTAVAFGGVLVPTATLVGDVIVEKGASICVRRGHPADYAAVIIRAAQRAGRGGTARTAGVDDRRWSGRDRRPQLRGARCDPRARMPRRERRDRARRPDHRREGRSWPRDRSCRGHDRAPGDVVPERGRERPSTAANGHRRPNLPQSTKPRATSELASGTARASPPRFASNQDALTRGGRAGRTIETPAPPSTTSTSPVSHDAASESRNERAGRDVVGDAEAADGVRRAIASSFGSHNARAMSVFTRPGAIAFTRTDGASSCASWRVR